MPLIIDANRASDFNAPAKHHAGEIAKRVFNREVSVAVGGKLYKELAKTAILALLVEWQRAGRILRISDDEISAETIRLEAVGTCSNDSHVLALALISGARLLYSEDVNLIKDFKNKNLVNPRGKVVTTATPARTAVAMLRKFGA